MHTRRQVWQKLAEDWKLPNLDSFANECTLSDITAQVELMLHGRQTGRVIVNMQ
jgi:hypothetical protein